MKLKKCPCGGDVMIFKGRGCTKEQLAQTERQHGKEAAETEKRALTFYWAECLACEAKGEERQSHEDAARVFNEIVNIQEENHVRVTQALSKIEGLKIEGAKAANDEKF